MVVVAECQGEVGFSYTYIKEPIVDHDDDYREYKKRKCDANGPSLCSLLAIGLFLCCCWFLLGARLFLARWSVSESRGDHCCDLKTKGLSAETLVLYNRKL